MTPLYRADVLIGQAHAPQYARVELRQGERLVADGQVLAGRNGYYTDAGSWFASKAEALLHAADQIEAICGQMLSVAHEQREAASEAAIEEIGHTTEDASNG